MMDSRAVDTAHRVRHCRCIGARVEDHNISTRNVPRTATNTSVTTERGHTHQRDAHEQKCTSSHNGWEFTRLQFTNPVSMVIPQNLSNDSLFHPATGRNIHFTE